jgi:hypothetical protein
MEKLKQTAGGSSGGPNVRRSEKTAELLGKQHGKQGADRDYATKDENGIEERTKFTH